MTQELLISSDPWENRVALLEDGRLAEIYFERDERVIGSIYKGKVVNVLPGMGASFVDIGLGRNAFLYVDDINKAPLNIGDVEITQGRTGYTIGEKVERGDDVLVQIVKEPRGLKGARISTNISLPGRYLILMPTGKYSGVSRKIESAAERDRLKGIMKLIRPDGMATVVRTAAANVSQAELIADLGVLIRMWHGILENFKRAQAPALIHRDMNLIYKAARDFITPEVTRVLIDDAEETEKVRDFMRLLGPQYVERISRYEGGRALFADFKVDEEVQRLMKPTASLPSGGSIVIESTEALTVIDVNSGKFTGGKNLEDTIVRTNIEAAAEIARQVRLRDIGGIIVCDFIDMSSESSRTKVVETLKAGLERDRTRTTIQSFSTLGLLEFTRKRIGKDLSGQLRGACPTCDGLGSVLSPESVAIETMRDVRKYAHDHARSKLAEIEARVAPLVGAQLEFWYEDEVLALEREIGAKVAVRVDRALHPERALVGLPGDIGALVAEPASVRVGDEFDVELLRAKLPTPTSALAVVGGRLVEVENAANVAGKSIRIKVLDVADDGSVLAEPRVPVADELERARRRRRRGGRGRSKPITAEEQTEELLELAEEAAKGQEARPPIGISTAAEPEDVEARLRAVPSRPFVAAAAVAPMRPEGEGDAEGEPRRRRRRRRRRRTGETAALAGIPQESLTAQVDDVDAGATVIPIEAGAVALGTAAEDPGHRRRRRRRRRRGRGAAGTEGAPALQAVPDRHIFRAASDGNVEATGITAPPDAPRAIAPVRRLSEAVAVDAPPPSLKLEAEPAKIARPVRRRKAATADIETAPAALPPPPAEAPARRKRAAAAPSAPVPAAEESAAPKRRGRPRKEVAATAPAPVKRARATATAEKAAPKKPATRKRASTTAATKLASGPKKPAAKKTTRKKSS